MAEGRFTEPGEIPINEAQFMVLVALGLAVTPDDAVRAMTGGVIEAPAPTLVFDAITVGVGSDFSGQLLMSAQSAAALHGSLIAWRARLPVSVRDQFDAHSAEASRLWTARVEQHYGPVTP